jgi:4-hydroxy-tetrahydrodipicolinate synthase
MENKNYRGIVVPLVTPLDESGGLDRLGLAALVEHVIGGGVNGIFILGTTGEGPNLNYQMRHEMIRESARLIAGRVPLFVSVTDTAYAESLALAQTGASVGADVAVMAAPYYFPLSDAELHQYTQQFVAASPLSVMLYNMPAMCKIGFSLNLVKQLMSNSKVVGIKDSSGDLNYYQALCELKKARADWTIMVGPEGLLIESVQLGGDGGVSGGANVLPRLFVDAYAAAVHADQLACEQYQKEINAFGNIYSYGSGAGRYISTTKYAIEKLGITSSRLTRPFQALGSSARDGIDSVLAEFTSSSGVGV